ncbi:MAG: DNA-3-methyladenine glycosylase 2 family protein [Oscillospiraceae bacterium]|jgi:N-glycosylase/DNA lyase|nr:DNA-3-methyladenine glycosylase 2 family protein [Oscillospiraceae bacterium]
MRVYFHENSRTVELSDFGGKTGFSLADTLDCGQCFRFFRQPDGSYKGVAGQKLIWAEQKDERLLFYNSDLSEFESLIRPFFDFDRDYAAIKSRMSRDKTLAQAIKYAPGIHILKQEPWEALCSFILSQNNNVRRIQGIIRRLCENFGDELPEAPGEFSFPSAEKLAAHEPEDLAPLRCGFRDKYVTDAARKAASGEVSLSGIAAAPIDEARQTLMKIKGVGPKVAECALLYGFQRLEAFPVDVWMKRAMAELFPGGLPDCAKDFAGIAQQYIFHYVRTDKSALAPA